MDIGPSELVIIVIILLLLFGGSRLAGLGKSAGRALKEFKEETQGRPADDRAVTSPSPAPAPDGSDELAAPPSKHPTQ